MRIMLVEDDQDDRTLFIESVKEFDKDIECLIARDGREALDILRNPISKLPDFIFMDLRMTRFNGKKCLSEIRKDNRLNHIPVVIYTTSRSVEEAKELLEMGATYFISKPTNPQEIYYMVSFALEEYWDYSNKNLKT